ncbi:Rieske 2Fe-2S domain-containing protein [Flavisphingomonas formosensis]|uniref:Rieske 2Fe-2S domain-containing protein n=1 Tax=Flavisphingomonas formosensis TaxID=861534 RepID=UPI0012FA2943|nr:Rieske 2Fe-2S domain-containing protein [Sphingomonas formosensis]
MAEADARPQARPVRMIESSPLPERFARGWHCLGPASLFKDGKPHAIEAFGTKLVVFQGADGTLNVLDAYCRHMGGDLSDGTIVGDTIACPFHDWRWAGDGRCTAVPYARKIPYGAVTRSWIAHEANKHLVIWHDPEGAPPDVDLPHIAGTEGDDWSEDWAWCEEIVENHPRELIDNLADMAHFFYVHGERKGGQPGYFKCVFDGQVATQYLESGSDDATPSYPRDAPYLGDPERIDGYLRSESSWHGPAYSVDYLWWRFPEIGVLHSVLFLSILPITPGRFRLGMGVLTRKHPDLDAEANHRRHLDNYEMLRGATFQDVRIWQRKARIDNPLLCEADGPVYRLRAWYDQYYVDRANVRRQSVERFEKQVDTDYANQVWAEELAGAAE